MDMDWLRGKCIGKGAFGTVHLAVDRATGQAFAVKSVDAKAAPAAALACLETEITILRRLSSPYVVAHLGDGATASTRDLHMELLPGGTAAEAAATKGGLGERAARGVLSRVVAALRYLHDDAGVVHGDVKGRNVLLGCDADECCGGGAKLADFGAARMLASDDVSRGPRGTPAWMAPEVARGGAATPASDVWSLGCTALELLTGKRPWSELGGAVAEVGELLFLIGFGGTRPAVPAHLSDACRDFIDKCLRRDAGQRWTCDQLLRHPFLSSDAAHDGAGEPSPYPSPRAVLDWAAVSDSDSEALVDDELEEPEAEEAMARAKGRVAELAASNGPRAAWGTSATWEADTWAPPPISEAPRAVVPVAPSTSNSDAGNGNAGWPATSIASSAAAAGRNHQVVGGVGTGGGLLCVHDRPGCQCHCCHYKYGFGVGWLPLAVVPWPMPSCYCSFPVDSIQSNFATNRTSTGFRTLFLLR